MTIGSHRLHLLRGRRVEVGLRIDIASVRRRKQTMIERASESYV